MFLEWIEKKEACKNKHTAVPVIRVGKLYGKFIPAGRIIGIIGELLYNHLACCTISILNNLYAFLCFGYSLSANIIACYNLAFGTVLCMNFLNTGCC